MPWSLYMETFGDPDPMIKAKRSLEPLSVSTMGYTEYDICHELHITHETYKKLSRHERKYWTFYFLLRSEKEKYYYEKSREDAERKSQINDPTPAGQKRFR